jgi:3'-phosphoadenosine 5'-phosphosulfate (PAPS) 3'-phosphatase
MIILTTPVQMTDEDVRKFLLFQKYYDIFKKLDEAKAFDILYGKVIMNISGGVIQNIVKEEVVYHK